MIMGSWEFNRKVLEEVIDGGGEAVILEIEDIEVEEEKMEGIDGDDDDDGSIRSGLVIPSSLAISDFTDEIDDHSLPPTSDASVGAADEVDGEAGGMEVWPKRKRK